MYLFFDTETTGIPLSYKAPLTDFKNWPRLVQLAYMVFNDKGNLIVECDFIIKPEGFVIPKEAENVHGISTERALQEGRDLKEVLDRFHELIASCDFVVGHNVSFDKNIVGSEFLRIGKENILSGKKSICTMMKSTNYCAIEGKYGFKWPSLTELYTKLFQKPFEDAHNALSDIRATAQCFWELKKLNVI